MIEDQILEEPELENQTKFEHYVQATGEIVEEFRDVLAAHTGSWSTRDVDPQSSANRDSKRK
jgi:hypothetical protein